MTGLGTGPHTGNGHDPTAAQPPRTGADRLSTTLELWQITEMARRKLSHTDIVVYLLIRCHARDGRNPAFPSRNTLAKEADCAPESVSRSTAKLEQLKLI